MSVYKCLLFFSPRNPVLKIQVSLGKQNIKEKEDHEQIFDGVETILHEEYKEKGGVPYNDIGKSFIWYSHGSPPTFVVWSASFPLKSM